MTTFTCTATTRHGDYTQSVTSTPQPTKAQALVEATTLVDIGYQPSAANTESARVGCYRWDNGERPAAGERYLSERYVYLSSDESDLPVVAIGWTDYTFTEEA